MSIHRWFTGFFLLLLMVAALFLNGWMFAARGFQEHFAKISGNGSGVVSMKQIREIQREVAMVEAQTAPRERELATLTLQVREANSAIDQLSKAVEAGTQDLAAKLVALEQKLQMRAAGDVTLPGLGARIERLEQNAAATSQAEVKLLRAQLDQLEAQSAEIVTKTEARAPLEAQMVALQTGLNADRQRLLTSKATFGDNFDEVVAEIESLTFSSPSGVGATLAQMHPIALSIWLVIVMGAMGSLLYLFPAYIANQPGNEVTFVSIIVRMVFGMVVALAFLIVANVGANIFAGAAPNQMVNFDSLGSFTIAGLGIIAGVMADDIAKSIHERGAFLFQGAGSNAGSLIGAARTRTIAPTKEDLPSGGLVNPHGGPGEA